MTDDVTRGRRWWVIGGLAAAFLVAVGALIGVVYAAPKDMYGLPVQADPDAIPNPEASATPDGSGRFVAAGVGLDVPLGSLDAVDGDITPPGFTSAYLIRNLGVTPRSAGMGAVYVVMHSLRDGGVAPGNYLIDVNHQRSKMAVGDSITVDGVDYTVTTTEAVSKSELASDAIWTAGPRTLIVVTCLQRLDGGPSVDNLIIEATQAAG